MQKIVFVKLGFIIGLGISLFIVLASRAWAQEAEVVDKPAELFFYRCAGCHTIGRGNLAGPDLKGATRWSDADLKIAVKKMEKNAGALSEADISQLVEFLKDLSVVERIDQQRQIAEAKMRAELPEASFEKGKELFRGNTMLVNGGPACIVCHHYVNEGGSLGPDLTHLKDKMSGVVLQSSIEKSIYKVMRPLYEKHKITQEEALHLSEYISYPEKVHQRLAPTLRDIILLSTTGSGAFIVMVWVMNKRRKGPTREKLVRKYKSH